LAFRTPEIPFFTHFVKGDQKGLRHHTFVQSPASMSIIAAANIATANVNAANNTGGNPNTANTANVNIAANTAAANFTAHIFRFNRKPAG
jgi:hypothetical protein